MEVKNHDKSHKIVFYYQIFYCFSLKHEIKCFLSSSKAFWLCEPVNDILRRQDCKLMSLPVMVFQIMHKYACI